MRRLLAILACGAMAMLGCNAILGIDSASLGPGTTPDGGAPAATGDDGGDPITCQHYCDVVMAACTGPNQEYLSSEICMQMCPVFELGTNSDSLRDTLGCRLWHAHAAMTAPSIHCPHAGPLGGDHCGDSCEAFCNLDTTYCAGTNLAYDGGFQGCLGACPAFQYDIGADAGDLTRESGDTLNYRLWHLQTAYSSPQAQAIHCPHTAVLSSMCQ